MEFSKFIKIHGQIWFAKENCRSSIMGKEEDDMANLGDDRWTSLSTFHAMLAKFPHHHSRVMPHQPRNLSIIDEVLGIDCPDHI